MTQNNSISMKTEVETYLIEETVALIYDNEKLDQWNKHVQELGLTGQTKIRKADKSPVPFLHMKQNLVNVFEVLCPRKEKVEAYSKTPIPVEILDLIALSKREGYFERIEIWYDEQSPDPACIGFRRGDRFDPIYPTWDSGFDKYLIGRWADVRAGLDQLTEKARLLFIGREKSRLSQSIKDSQRMLEDVVNNADRRFGVIGENAEPLPF